MARSVNSILDDVRKVAQTKTASFGKQALSGQDPASMPGSEHDSKTPDEAKKPSPEVKDETMVPNSGLSTAGAKDDSPKTRGHALEADEAALEPTKKPAITSDANAKTASSDLANEILSSIRGYQVKVAEEGCKDKSEPKDKQELSKEPKVEPAITDKADKAAAAAKVASRPDMVLTTDVMAKIAAIVLSTEEGAQFVEEQLAKEAGAEAARETFAFLNGQSELAEKAAAFEQGEADAQALIEAQIFEAGRQAGVKQAQDMAGLPPEAGAVPGADAAAGAMAGAPAEGAPAEGGEGGGEELTIEDIAAALEQLVSEGQLKPEEAQQVVEALVGGGEGGAEGAPAPEAGAEGGGEAAPAPAPEGAPAEEKKEDGAEAKEASAVQANASALLAAIRSFKK